MSSVNSNIVIVAASRTPMGGFQGALSDKSVTELGEGVIRAAIEKSNIAADQIDEVIMGCALPAGAGQAPARQSALKAGLPDDVPCTTINKVCGSGMKAVMLGASQLKNGEAKLVVAGGMESMTNAPYLLDKARGGMRLGHGKMLDHMFTDGLEDAYEGRAMGVFSQQTADRFNISREAMDDYAFQSLERATKAIASGVFIDEISPVETRKGLVEVDEQPGKARPDKIRSLPPAFAKDGTVTAANSSSISDGAAALILMREEDALAQGLTPLARIAGYVSHAQKPEEFTLAPIDGIRKLLDKVSWKVEDVDLFEINEAFAVVTMLAIKELSLDEDRVNIYGGACALGHPLGASGARILVTLLHALKRTEGKRGVASLCIGGGEATAIAVETL
ncbi:acetyl-CoA acetyltransferase [Endozoicomonas sp. (ex Bugula neritina AB1)]|nr:acetyl-CoA acetyltransferase [Endozoicomonas sp. (ex Bugula neritina AB1)]